MEIPSTQDTLASCDGQKLADGLVLHADVQTKGRGRGGNKWVSPRGCLMFSMKHTVTSGSQLPFVQYVISLAIVKAVRRLAAVDVSGIKIKWPNDIYLQRELKPNSSFSGASFMCPLVLG